MHVPSALPATLRQIKNHLTVRVEPAQRTLTAIGTPQVQCTDPSHMDLSDSWQVMSLIFWPKVDVGQLGLSENEHAKDGESLDCLLKTHGYCSAAEEHLEAGCS